MKNHKKTLLGSVLTFIVGTSCCWLSSLAVWMGGASILVIIVNWIEYWQVVILIISGLLAFITFYLKFIKN